MQKPFNARSFLHLLAKSTVDVVMTRPDGAECQLSGARLLRVDAETARLTLEHPLLADSESELADVVLVRSSTDVELPAAMLDRARLLPRHTIARRAADGRVEALGDGAVLRLDPSGFAAIAPIDADVPRLLWMPSSVALTRGPRATGRSSAGASGFSRRRSMQTRSSAVDRDAAARLASGGR